MLRDILERIERRLEATGLTASAAGKAAGHKDAIRNLQRAVAGKKEARQGITTATLVALAPVLGTTASWLLEGVGPEGVPLVPIVGTVGESPDGVVVQRGLADAYELVAQPPGLSPSGAALEVVGHGLKGFADDGALIYFDERLERPDSLIGRPVVSKLADGRMVVARLLRGAEPGVYDIEPLSGPTLTGRVEWAAPISAWIEPAAAARITRHRDEL